jgi:hypothetical protein
VNLISRKAGIKEEVIWEDLKKVKTGTLKDEGAFEHKHEEAKADKRSRTEEYSEILLWLKDDPEDRDLLLKKSELESLIKIEELDEKIDELSIRLRAGDEKVLGEIDKLTRARDEERRRIM